MYCHLLILLYHLRFVFSSEVPKLPDYCSLDCGGTPQTICARNYVCVPVKNCTTMHVDASFRENMLSAHNKLRNELASGGRKGLYGNTGAKNMQSLTYDMELEFLAECWASSCPGFKHDGCRRTDRFSVGQNIFYAKNVRDPKQAVNYWFHEGLRQTKDVKWIRKFPFNPDEFKNQSRVLHFSQMVWAQTKYMGCVWAKSGPDKIQSLIVCNYGPAGNIKGASIYNMATHPSLIAEHCPEGRNPKYRFLCGCVKPVPEDPSWAKTYNFKISKPGGVVKAGGTRIRSQSIQFLLIFVVIVWFLNISKL